MIGVKSPFDGMARKKEKGRVDKTIISSKSFGSHRQLTKDARKLKSKQKRDLLKSQQRAQRQPKVFRHIAILSLSESVDAEEYRHHLIADCEEPINNIDFLDVTGKPRSSDDATPQKPVNKPWMIRYKPQKQNLLIYSVPRNLDAVLAAGYSADIFLIIVDAYRGTDDEGDRFYKALKAQGICSVVGVLANLGLETKKQQKHNKRAMTYFFKYNFDSDSPVLMADASNNIMRHLCSVKSHQVPWLDCRPRVSVLGAKMTDSKDCLDFVGVVQGGIVDVGPVWACGAVGGGMCECVAIEKVLPHKKQHSSSSSSKSNVEEEEEGAVAGATSLKDEQGSDQPTPKSLLAGSVSSEEEDESMSTVAVNTKKNATTTASDAASIVSQSSEQAVARFEKEEEEEVVDHIETFEELYTTVDGDSFKRKKGGLKQTTDGEEGEEEEGEIARMDEEEEGEDEWIYDRIDPDEVDTPDIPMRDRFSKYIGLKSFRTTPWPANDVPDIFSSFTQFRSYSNAKRRVEDMVASQNKYSLIHKTDDSLIRVGDVVKMRLRVDPSKFHGFYSKMFGMAPSDVSVPPSASVLCELMNSSPLPLSVFSLFKFEHDPTVMHLRVQKRRKVTFGEDGEEVEDEEREEEEELRGAYIHKKALQKSLISGEDGTASSEDEKEENYKRPVCRIRVGFMCIDCRPIVSVPPDLGGDKYKELRTDRHDISYIIMSFVGPMILTHMPVLVFQEDTSTSPCVETSSGHPLDITYTGKIHSCNPSLPLIRRIIVAGHPMKVGQRLQTVRDLFQDIDDIRYYKPVELATKHGKYGFIQESVGMHGKFKASFNHPITHADTVMLKLYRRISCKFSDVCPFGAKKIDCKEFDEEDSILDE
ncbi:Ribosome biogenesis protein Bms1/Tsr1 like protein [Aduncisulcus paluster]|uniref:Ribosome biogenesis protein Bms1/Tsr1 like protein n=1 Tax=Aduncisulcus paluster TaxID=2918883 RepID=A0ABQ5JZM4_9EUKA|nr:Ribosome biogenesis protein Bms1/Tsr1 like protein [Aduncisulcus paluster]